MDHQLRRTALAGRLPELAVDAFLITGLTNVRYLTGFTGSSGQALVAGTGSIFFTDGRYTEQSRHEVADMDRVTAPGSLAQSVAEQTDSPRHLHARLRGQPGHGPNARAARVGDAGYHAGAVGR